MKKTLPTTLLITTIIIGLTLNNYAHFTLAQTGTNISGIINTNTTWTKTNSPYNLTGPTAVNNGVTLTIEAGATVNLNGHDLEVDGVLLARGSAINPIRIYGTSGSETIYIGNAECIIQNAIFNGNIFVSVVGNPIISNNNILGSITFGTGGNPVVCNNTITSPTSGAFAGINFGAGNATISNNTISGFKQGIHSERTRYTAAVDYGQGIRHIEVTTKPVFSNNTISACTNGIYAESSEAIFSNNTITNCPIGIRVAEGNNMDLCIQTNLIMRNDEGILLLSGARIYNNTITNNSNGIHIGNGMVTLDITHNNIYGNSNYNIYSSASNDLNCRNNWWGTTDNQAINQTIYDFKEDFTLGTVTFTPFLNTPNSAAPAMPTPAPTPTPSPIPMSTSTPNQSPIQSPSQYPTSSPEPSSTQTTTQPEATGIEVAILALLIVIAALLTVYIALVLKKKR